MKARAIPVLPLVGSTKVVWGWAGGGETRRQQAPFHAAFVFSPSKTKESCEPTPTQLSAKRCCRPAAAPHHTLPGAILPASSASLIMLREGEAGHKCAAGETQQQHLVHPCAGHRFLGTCGMFETLLRPLPPRMRQQLRAGPPPCPSLQASTWLAPQ